MSEDCIFCKIAKGEIPVTKVYESNNFLAFLDQAPQVEGHTLIIPKEHSINILSLPSTLGQELLDVIKKVAEIKFREGFEGFNLVQNNFSAGGQVVMHTHFHLLPRKTGDGHQIFVNNSINVETKNLFEKIKSNL